MLSLSGSTVSARIAPVSEFPYATAATPDFHGYTTRLAPVGVRGRGHGPPSTASNAADKARPPHGRALFLSTAALDHRWVRSVGRNSAEVQGHGNRVSVTRAGGRVHRIYEKTVATRKRRCTDMLTRYNLVELGATAQLEKVFPSICRTVTGKCAGSRVH